MTELLDVQAGFGGFVPGAREPVSAEWLQGQLRRHRIAQAVVRIVPERHDFDLCLSNERLYTAAAACPEFLPCPVLAPAACGDLPDEEAQVADALRRGAAAVVLRPGPDRWEPETWVAGPLLRALAARRVPVLCPESLVPLGVVARWAACEPGLPLIVTGLNYGQDRTLIPLLRTFPNTFLSIGNNFTAHRALELYVERVGAERLLFGTGLPDSEPGAAIGQLVFAEISDADRCSIGAGNLRRLLGGILR